MRIRIFLGTGGVGKTSVAAASALREAAGGKKCLALTIDPALRLRTALGLSSNSVLQQVTLDPAWASGELWAGILDVKHTLDESVRLHAKPKQAEIVLNHPIYQALIASLAGMQELLAIERLDQVMQEGFEEIYIDTAPSRHALEFLDKPEHFSQLVSIPVVRLVGRTYKWWEKTRLMRLGRKSFELYTRVEELLGASMVRQVLDFFAVFQSIAEGYGERAKKTLKLLHDPKYCGFTIVTTPSKALRDTEYFMGELTKRNFHAECLVVNRIWPELALPVKEDAPSEVKRLAAWYRSSSEAHNKACQQVTQAYQQKMPRIIAVPELPVDIDGLEALRLLGDKIR